MSATSFLGIPDTSAQAQRLYDDDVSAVGYVMNASRLWAYQPDTHDGLFDLMRQAFSATGLDIRQRGILVTACAATLGDSYCSLAWGGKLAAVADATTAAAVLRGSDEGLSDREVVMAGWARKVAGDPNGTNKEDVQALRDVGFSDIQIFGMTTFIALRLAFSTVNDALGARPDAAYRDTAPEPVRHAVTYGRPIADETS